MKSLATLLIVAGLAYVAYEVARLVYLMYVSRGLVAQAEKFERGAGQRTMLVLGDSTAVGVGVSGSQYSLAGRLAGALDASVENRAESGAVTADLADQIAGANRPTYDLILIQIGANDVIGFRNADGAQDALDGVLEKASGMSKRIVLLTAGKIGNAPLFPWFIRTLMTSRAADLRERFMATAGEYGATYVDLYTIQDPFGSDPARYYAPDGLHLADDGYGFWYEATRAATAAAWPDLYE